MSERRGKTVSDLVYLKDYQTSHLMRPPEEKISSDKGVQTPHDLRPAMPPRGRTTPSGAVAWIWEKLKDRHIQARTVVDIGCGKGRNSLFLARKGFHVTAMDITPDAIETLQKQAKREKLDSKIRAFVHNVTEDWPIEPRSISLAIDAFCFRHLASKYEYQSYKDNLLRTLSPRGSYLLSLASIGDGYYGSYVRKPDQVPMPVDDAVRIDPIDGIESSIYSRDKIIKFFAPELKVCAELESFDALAKSGDDGTYALLFRRSPKWFYTY